MYNTATIDNAFELSINVKQRTHESYIEAAQRGDEAAFRHLYNDYRAKVVGIVRNVIGPAQDIDDVVQVVFIEIFRSIRRYKGDSKLSTWIYRLTVNVALQSLRKKKRHRGVIPFGETEVFDRQSSLDLASQMQDRDLLRRLYGFLDEIKPKKRAVYVLHEIQGMEVEEIASVVDASVNTVKSRLFHARKEIMSKLKRAKLI